MGEVVCIKKRRGSGALNNKNEFMVNIIHMREERSILIGILESRDVAKPTLTCSANVLWSANLGFQTLFFLHRLQLTFSFRCTST